MIANRWIISVVFSIVILPTCGAADEPAAFRFTRPIRVDGLTQEELVAVPLDSDVFAATRDGFPDLRVVGADGRLVPFLIRRVSETRTQKVRQWWTATNPALRPLENNGMEIRFALKPKDPQPVGLRVVTPLQNFEQQVRIFSTADGTETALVEEALIFDYSQYMDVRRTEVPLPITTAREFRIVIDALTSDQESPLLVMTRSMTGGDESNRTEETAIHRRPFRIDRIELWTEEAYQLHQADLVQAWPVTDLKVTQDAEHQQTVAEFTSRREPLSELRIVTSSRNFSRPATVQIGTESGVGMKWLDVATSRVSQFQLRNLQEEHVTISLPETRHDRLRLIIDNGDSPALAIDAVEAVGHQYEVVYLAAPDTQYRLKYGSESADAPSHDTVALSTALAQNMSPIAATLGPQSAPNLKPAELKTLLNNPFVLGAIVSVLVTVLGWGLYQASRRIEGMPPEDGA